MSEPIGLFSSFLAAHHRGITDSELTAALRDLLSEVRRLGDKATGTLTLQVKVLALDDDESVGISGKVDLKLPREAPRAIHYWVDDQNMPTRNHPQQTIEFGG